MNQESTTAMDLAMLSSSDCWLLSNLILEGYVMLKLIENEGIDMSNWYVSIIIRGEFIDDIRQAIAKCRVNKYHLQINSDERQSIFTSEVLRF